MNLKEAIAVIKDRIAYDGRLIENPQSDFDKFVLREKEALEMALIALDTPDFFVCQNCGHKCFKQSMKKDEVYCRLHGM